MENDTIQDLRVTNEIPIDTPSNRVFTRERVEKLLSAAIGKTLLEVDASGQFASHAGHTKVTGIAGDVIEVSVLGCHKDCKQEPDIMVDGVRVELKTTGVIKPKKQDSPYVYECKEPVSITAVSIPVIINEEFETSNFWHKLAHMLWVYYWYNSSTTVALDGYKNFPVLGFQFYEFSADDKLRLKQDWLIVRDFLIVIHREYSTQKERDAQYPRLSSELRSQLMLIDTAPKFPHSPRFRLKRSFATIIADQYFSNRHLEKLASPITKYSDIDEKCKQLTSMYGGKTFAEIADWLGVSLRSDKAKEGTSHYMTDKNFAELVVLKMFGSKAKSLNAIEDFAKIGLIAKSLPLNSKGVPKESMKMFTPNFEEWINEEHFDESFLRDYFAEHQFLFMAYQYTDSKIKSPESIKFVGFKRVYFTDNFIETSVRRFWEDVRSLVKDNGLKIVKEYRADGSPIINPKSGTQKEAPNFPKEADYDVFMRGSASTSSESSKTLVINGLRMLPQEVWLAKRVTIDLFNNQTI
ncbi:MAG: hypothetical protein IKU35_03990 [Bacteroidaceae bacterium]|nr:hypothetical protein [Bacteroidaceae bacterium]